MNVLNLEKNGKRSRFFEKLQHNEFNDDMLVDIRYFIYYKFKQSIYDDPTKPPDGPNTGEFLITKIYNMVWTPERREHEKKKRREANEQARVEKAKKIGQRTSSS